MTVVRGVTKLPVRVVSPREHVSGGGQDQTVCETAGEVGIDGRDRGRNDGLGKRVAQRRPVVP